MNAEPSGTEPETEPDLVVDERGVAAVRLNRPLHHNRLEPGDIDALHEMFAAIDAADGIRCVLLTARGRTFCAGYDLSDLGAAGAETGGPSGIDLLASTVDRLERLRVPTLAVLNGPVYGGGTDLALACDLRIGVTACRMTMPAGRFGLHYYHGGLRRYVERLGLGAAKRLFLLGEALDAQQMLQVGYLDEVYPDLDALEARARSILATILDAADPAVLASMKLCLDRIAAGDRDPTIADEYWAATKRSPRVGAAVARSRSGVRRGSPAKP